MNTTHRELITQRLIQQRRSTGLEISEFSKISGISESRIRNFECGIRTPKIDAYIDLAEYYNCSPAYLAGLTNIKDDDYVAAMNSHAPIAFFKESLKEKNINQNFIVIIEVTDNEFSNLKKGDYVLIDKTKNIAKEEKKDAIYATNNNDVVTFCFYDSLKVNDLIFGKVVGKYTWID